jgi:hypothetical protein
MPIEGYPKRGKPYKKQDRFDYYDKLFRDFPNMPETIQADLLKERAQYEAIEGDWIVWVSEAPDESCERHYSHEEHIAMLQRILERAEAQGDANQIREARKGIEDAQQKKSRYLMVCTTIQGHIEAATPHDLAQLPAPQKEPDP